MRKEFWSVLITAMMLSGTAFARGAVSGWMFTANAFMENVTAETSGVSSDVKRLHYDLKLGNVSGGGLYLGAIYYSESEASGGVTSDGSGYGPSIGYMGSSGFFIQGHYLLGAKFGQYSEGKGIQADLGYLTDISPAVVVGVELRYRSVEYKELGGVKIDGDKVTRLIPMFTLGFLF